MIHFTDQDIQDTYDLYVVQHYATEGEPITLEWFFENVWNEWTDRRRMEMLWEHRNQNRE